MRSLVIPALLALALAACSGRDDASVQQAGSARSTVVQRAPLPALGPGDLVITTRGGQVDLALVRDRVLMRLSDSTMRDVRSDLDTRASTEKGFGGWIERTVKSGVSKVLEHQIEVPVADIRDVRYENGELRFDLRNKTRLDMRTIKVDDKPALESFAPADAERFVAAVHAAMRREGGR
jgi:citrate lyase gamma subunit